MWTCQGRQRLLRNAGSASAAVPDVLHADGATRSRRLLQLQQARQSSGVCAHTLVAPRLWRRSSLRERDAKGLHACNEGLS